MSGKISILEELYLFTYLSILPISHILPAVELQPERPEGNRRRAKLHLGKNYFLKKSFIIGEKTFEKPKSDNPHLLEVLKKQEYKTGLYYNGNEFINHLSYRRRHALKTMIDYDVDIYTYCIIKLKRVDSDYFNSAI